ncbi:MAG: hypothetical protein IJX26_00975, partial [Clostridia bacterium]|nr:hypothetical protein [Clostridia bacterium]
FFNTPARRKFLRKPKQEENEITNIVSRYILANPTIKFKYIVDSKPIYTTTGENLLNAIECVYGEETTQNILPIDIRDKNLHLYGFVSKIAFTKPNTTYQTLLVNNRYVVDETVSKAVYIAYEEFLMSRQFPFFVLNLDMPFTDVDVNVNPNKLTIKFSRPSLIFDFIYNNVKKVIYDSFLVKSKNKFNEIKVELPEEISEVDVEGEVIDTPKFFDNKITFKQNFGNNISFFYKSSTNSTNYDKLTSILEKNGDITNKKSFLAENLTQVKSDKENIEMVAPKAKYESTLFSNFKPVEDTSYQPIVDFSDYKIIGEIFNEFIILEKDEKMLLIDFHAGHERLLFDDFIKKQAEKKIVVQDLLVPYIQTFSAKEIEYILGFKNDFTALGFDIDQISPYEIRISAVPMLVKDLDLSKFLNDIVNDINNFKPNISYQIDQYLMKTACRSAVKAGQTLNEMQIKALLKGLDINNPVLLCPHGRPIVTVVSKNQIEKWFKRIV